MFDKLFGEKWRSARPLRVTNALIHRFYEHGIGYTGGQIAYFFLLSIFPFLIFINALVASFNIPSGAAFELLSPFFPQQIAEFITRYIEYVSLNKSYSLLSFGIVLAIFSASKSVRSLALAFNKAYDVPFRRGFFAQLLFSMLFILLFGIVILISTILVMLGNEMISRLIDEISVSLAFVDLFTVWRWLTMSVLLFFIISAVYKIVPDKKLKFSEVIPGTFFSLAGFLLLTVIFSVYVNHFLASSAFYGSIGAVILLMLWMYFAGIILVLGAELNNIMSGEV